MRAGLILIFVVVFLTGCQKQAPAVRVLIETPYGNMTFRLFNSTPRHRDNFVKLANEAFFDSLLFHKVNGLVVQGGDPDSKYAPPGKLLGFGDNGQTVDPEIGAPHFRGALAAARSSDAVNPEKRSSGSQFYIVRGLPCTRAQLDEVEKNNRIHYSDEQREVYQTQGGYPELDRDYTVFGQLEEGFEVLDQISTQSADAHGRPLTDIRIKVRVLH